MKQAQSAKDKAFEADRVKYRQQIRQLELANRKQLENEYALLEELRLAKDELRSKEEYIDRLLVYMDYQTEELAHRVVTEKAMSTVFGIIGAMGIGRSIL